MDYRSKSKQNIEIWKDIPGYKGIYKVSNLGNIKSLARFKSGRYCKEHLLKPGIHNKNSDKTKYLIVVLYKDKSTSFLVHTLVLLVFDRPKLKNEECRHLDGNSMNNKLYNLKWGTPTENNNDRVLHGTGNEGEKCGHAKLTNEQVLDIRKSYKVGKVFQKDLAKNYNVHVMTISDIIRNKTWKHI